MAFLNWLFGSEAAKPKSVFKALDDNGSVFEVDGVQYERDSGFRWRNSQTGVQPEHELYMELCRHADMERHNKTAERIRKKEMYFDPETGASIQFSNRLLGLRHADKLITLATGEEYFCTSVTWQSLPDCYDQRGAADRFLSDIDGRVRFLIDKGQIQAVKPVEKSEHVIPSTPLIEGQNL